MPANQKQQKIGKVPNFMAFLSGQCRAARGFLSWSQAELGQRAKVDAKTIADFERGIRSPHPRTLDALAKAFEADGIVFLEASDTLATGVGVRIGSEAAKRMGASGGGADKDGGLKAAAWEEEPPVPAEIEKLRAYWRDHPDQWAALSETGRRTLSEKMFDAPEAGWLGQG
jgi:transcriptional regulator with XRE-family HTH domain